MLEDVISDKRNAPSKMRPTKRAADVWDSARFSSIFLAWSFFLLPSRISSHPHAANANRYIASTRVVLSQGCW
jgi:hypothetical protein